MLIYTSRFDAQTRTRTKLYVTKSVFPPSWFPRLLSSATLSLKIFLLSKFDRSKGHRFTPNYIRTKLPVQHGYYFPIIVFDMSAFPFFFIIIFSMPPILRRSSQHQSHSRVVANVSRATKTRTHHRSVWRLLARCHRQPLAEWKMKNPREEKNNKNSRTADGRNRDSANVTGWSCKNTDAGCWQCYVSSCQPHPPRSHAPKRSNGFCSTRALLDAVVSVLRTHTRLNYSALSFLMRNVYECGSVNRDRRLGRGGKQEKKKKNQENPSRAPEIPELFQTANEPRF